MVYWTQSVLLSSSFKMDFSGSNLWTSTSTSQGSNLNSIYLSVHRSLSNPSFLFSHAYEQNGKWVGCEWINCSDNKIRFPSKLREHLRLHTGEKAVACPSCGNNFATRAKVRKRIKIRII